MKVKTSGEIFRSGLIPAVAALYTLAALLGTVGVVLLFDPGYAEILRNDLILGGFGDVSAQQTWTVINTCVTIACFLCPCTAAVLLWSCMTKHRLRSLLTLTRVIPWLLRAVNLGGVLAVILFAIRFVAYLAASIPTDMAAYSIMAVLLFETPMVAQAVAMFFLLRKFLNCIMDSAAGIADALASGKPEKCSIPDFACTGFLLMGIITLLLSVDRAFTLTVVEDYIQDYYAILTPEHPGMWISAANLLVLSIGNFLLSVYLRRCKRDTERCAFYASRLRP